MSSGPGEQWIKRPQWKKPGSSCAASGDSGVDWRPVFTLVDAPTSLSPCAHGDVGPLMFFSAQLCCLRLRRTVILIAFPVKPETTKIPSLRKKRALKTGSKTGTSQCEQRSPRGPWDPGGATRRAWRSHAPQHFPPPLRGFCLTASPSRISSRAWPMVSRCGESAAQNDQAAPRYVGRTDSALGEHPGYWANKRAVPGIWEPPGFCPAHRAQVLWGPRRSGIRSHSGVSTSRLESSGG